MGITHFRHVPFELSHLPARFLSHSSQYGELAPLRSRRVAVIGGGASAIDIAGLLGELGTHVHLFARSPELQIHTKDKLPRTIWHRARRPMSGVGTGWKSLFYSDTPGLFHHLPERLRVRQVKSGIRPRQLVGL